MTALPVLELRHWGVAFGAREVLRDVSFGVPANGCTVLLGPSGTGKSTLLRTLAGYNRFHAQMRCWGDALYAGAPCADGHRPALVMQDSRLLVSNVLENLVCDLPRRSSLTRAAQLRALEPLLAECGQLALLERLDAKVVERPLVEQRVIAILRQAVAAPELLMIDEPTAGLSAPDADALLGMLERLARRRALLVVLHNLREARRLAGHVVLLADGRVQEAQDSPDFFDRSVSPAARIFVSTGSCPEQGSALPPTPPPAVQPASESWGPRGFVWLLPGKLAGTPWPGVVHPTDYDLQALRQVGVTHLISLTEEPFPSAVAARFGIACSAFAMPDMHPPTLAQALLLCASIDRLLAAGEVVAVHCRAGQGRTGTVLAAYWLWQAGGRLGAVQALEDVRRREPRWVQSAAQVSFLEEFAPVVADRAASRRSSHDPAAMPDVMAPIG